MKRKQLLESDRVKEGDKKKKKTSKVAKIATQLSTDHQSPVATTKNVTDLMDWLIQQGAQGLESLEFKQSGQCHESLGCFARKSFAVGEVLFSIPQKIIFSPYEFLTNDLSTSVLNFSRDHQILEKFRITSELLIWLNMIHNKRIGSDRTRTYFLSLDEKSPSLLNYDDDILSIISETNLGVSLSTLKRSIEAHYKFLKKLLECDEDRYLSIFPYGMIAKEELYWACGHYLSRRYPLHLSRSGDSGLSVDLAREENFGNLGCLVPLLDILNHDASHDYLTFRATDGELQVLCNHPRQEGEELFSNYGLLSNEQLLFAFGFSLAQNPHENFAVKLKSARNTRENIYYIPFGGLRSVPKELWQSLYEIVSAQSEMASDPITIGGDEEHAFQVPSIECCEIFCNYVIDKLSLLSELYNTHRKQLIAQELSEFIEFPDLSDETLSYENLLEYYQQTLQRYSQREKQRNAVDNTAHLHQMRWLNLLQYLSGQRDILILLATELLQILEDSEEDIEDDSEA